MHWDFNIIDISPYLFENTFKSQPEKKQNRPECIAITITPIRSITMYDILIPSPGLLWLLFNQF